MIRQWRHVGRNNRVTRVESLHFASLADPHALPMRLSIMPENFDGDFEVITGLRLCEKCEAPLQVLKRAANGACIVKLQTRFTGLRAYQGHLSSIPAAGSTAQEECVSGEWELLKKWRWRAKSGESVALEKMSAIFTSRDEGPFSESRLRRYLEHMRERGFWDLMLEHVTAWDARWRDAEIVVVGDAEAQRWINFAAYHLISAGNHRDDRVSIGARALTGPIYKGHVFWDSEMFILPFFIFTHPETARAMLMYRYHTLPAAREKAASVGCRGALFAWESAISGKEMTPVAALAPNGDIIPILSGKLEQHIDSAIAYGVWSYWLATGDMDFMLEAGAEILIETARFWASRAERDGETYHIRNVEGPDEYHEGVDDSVYTNMMAGWNILRAIDIIERLKRRHPEGLARLREKLGLGPREPSAWRKVAEGLSIPKSRDGTLLEQFQGFFGLEDIDVRLFEPRTGALDVILGRERTQNTQLVKQADVVMLLYLLEGHFSNEQLHANFSYYERRTAHGSSLSPAIYGLVAARLGLAQSALGYYRMAGEVDLANNMGNAIGGIHVAAMGGLWLQTISGFAGLRYDEEALFLYPHLPNKWQRLRFSLHWRQAQLSIEVVRKRRIVLRSEGEGPFSVGIHGSKARTCEAGHTYTSSWDGKGWLDFEEQE